MRWWTWPLLVQTAAPILHLVGIAVFGDPVGGLIWFTWPWAALGWAFLTWRLLGLRAAWIAGTIGFVVRALLLAVIVASLRA